MLANGFKQKRRNVGMIYLYTKLKNQKKDDQFMFIDDPLEASISEESNKHVLDD
jgi:hypothetical protein